MIRLLLACWVAAIAVSAALAPELTLVLLLAGLPIALLFADRTRVDVLAPHPAEADDDAPVRFRCPRCQRVSHHPADIREGYCGHCHDWTGE